MQTATSQIPAPQTLPEARERRSSSAVKSRCFFIGTSWAETAVSQHFRALAQELVNRGHRVIMFVDHHRHDVEDHEGNPSIYTWPSYRPVNFRDGWMLHSMIRQHRPDCVVATFGSTNIMLVTSWLDHVPKRVAWYLTLTEAIDIDTEMSRARVKLLRLRKRWVYKLATHIVPNSQAGSEDVQRAFGVPADKCHVSYLSLPDPATGNGHAEHAEAANNRLVCVGRLHKTKGQDILIHAVARLKHAIPDVHVEFIGDGPCHQSLIELGKKLDVSDRLTFSGLLPHDEVLRRMAQSPVTVAPSRSECFGLVNLESLAVGTPVIACDVGGIGEIFRDGIEGYLIAPEDDQALADRLGKVLTDDELRHRMSHQARRRFLEFEQQRVIGTHADWLEQLFESPEEKQTR